MNHPIRIIPRLDIKGSNLVKGVNLEGLRVLGSPHRFAKYYYEQGADELFYQDVVASLYGRNSLKKMITNTAENIFIPLTVGGGIRNVTDISEILRSGADRVSINSAAVKNPKFITEAAEKFGRSTIVISIEAIEQKKEGTEVTIIDGGTEFHFVMDDDFDTILDGALAAGADLPFACKGGVCSTCKCKIIEGAVTMKVNYALEEYEVTKNFVLSCQAVPTTKKVVVDFDV